MIIIHDQAFKIYSKGMNYFEHEDRFYQLRNEKVLENKDFYEKIFVFFVELMEILPFNFFIFLIVFFLAPHNSIFKVWESL